MGFDLFGAKVRIILRTTKCFRIICKVHLTIALTLIALGEFSCIYTLNIRNFVYSLEFRV